MLSIEDLEFKNQWWSDPSFVIKESLFEQRDLFSVIQKNLEHSLILNITGIRRVGKSTLIKQVIFNLLQSGVKPQNIFYYLFDYSIQPQNENYLDQVLMLYFKEIQKKPYSSLDQKVYLMLDEIQYINNWQAILKRYYDLSDKNIKFIITGSQSLLLKNKDRESLAGRIFDFYLPPLSFQEFLKINHEEIKSEIKLDLFNLPESFSELVGFNLYFGSKTAELAREYTLYGQFPENRKIKDFNLRNEYIKNSVIGKILDDCVNIYGIEKKDEFKQVAFHLLNNIASLFEVSNIGREVAVSRVTLEKFIEYLKEGFLIELFYKYHKSLIKKGKLLKKVYSTSTNFSCALSSFDQADIEKHPEIFGKIIENGIYNSLRCRYKSEPLREPLSFWRQGEKEIDFILSIDKNILPIEVKFLKNINLKELTTLVNYVKEKKLKYGLLVTKNELDRKEINNQTIYFLPYYLILLMV